MQGLADGYFILPVTIGDYLAPLLGREPADVAGAAFAEAEEAVRARVAGYLSAGGEHSVDWFHRELGKIMWDACGMARNGAGPRARDGRRSRRCTSASARACACSATTSRSNQSLEKAGRVDDFFELAQLMCRDALHREESCGGHFREEHQTPDGEALRDDDNFSYVAAWEYAGRRAGAAPEPLSFQHVRPTQRSYA